MYLTKRGITKYCIFNRSDRGGNIDVRELLATASDIKVRVDKEKRFAEITADFPKTSRKQLLYQA